MSNYEQLKAAISEVIKTNGNEEITGQITQDVLNAIVNTIATGSIYSGIAIPETNPGNPDANLFYIATTPGLYANFGGAIVNPNEIAIFVNNASNAWVKQIILSNMATTTDIGKGIVSVPAVLSEFAGTIRDFMVNIKYDTEAEPGLPNIYLSTWANNNVILGGTRKADSNWLHTFSISNIGSFDGVNLYYGTNQYFDVWLVADASKQPVLSTYPTMALSIEAAKPQKIHQAVNDARLSLRIDTTDIRLGNVVPIVDNGLFTPSFGYLLESEFAKPYSGDSLGLCMYCKINKDVTIDKILSQFKYTLAAIGKVTAVLKFASAMNITPTSGGTIIATKLVSMDDLHETGNFVYNLDDKFIAPSNGYIVLFMTYATGVAGANGLSMQYLNLGSHTTPPEHTNELPGFYRYSGTAWGFFDNNGTYAYQYSIPLILTTQNYYYKRLNELEGEISKNTMNVANALPKTNVIQQGAENAYYGNFYTQSNRWAGLPGSGLVSVWSQAKKDIKTDLIQVPFYHNGAGYDVKIKVIVKPINTLSNADLTGQYVIFEKDINTLELPSIKTMYNLLLDKEYTIANGMYVFVVMYQQLELGVTANALYSWVFNVNFDTAEYLTIPQVYRVNSYNSTTGTWNFEYFSYSAMVTYNNYIANIEPIFAKQGESGQTLRSDINTNTQRIETLEAQGATSKFYSRSCLPSQLHAAVGLQFNLYFDAFNLLPEYGTGQPGWMFNIQSELESTWRGLHYRSYRRTMQAGDIGNHTLTVDYYTTRNQTLSTTTPDERFTTALKVVAAANPTTQKRMCIIGDSTNEGGNVANRIYKNVQAATGVPVIMLGTRSDATQTWRHEARTEKTYSMFANGETVIRIDFTGLTGITQADIVTANPSPIYNIGGVNVILRHLWHLNGDGTGYAIGYNNGSVNLDWTGIATKTSGAAIMPSSVNVTKVTRPTGWSPFKNNEGVGVLDFAYYRTVILGLAANEKIDIMFSDLGINDIYTGGKSEQSIIDIVNNAKKLIDAFNADGNGIWAVCYPKSRSSAIATSDRRHYPMRIDMQRLREKLIEAFDKGAYGENVVICGSGMQLDRWFGYPMTTANVASRIEIPVENPVEGVHPNDGGYQQIGDAMTASLWYLLNQ